MLRWGLLILLLLNGVLYGWFYQEQEQRRLLADRVDAPLHGVAGLDLVSEVPGSVLRMRSREWVVSGAVFSGEVASGGATSVKAPVEQYCFGFGPFAEAQGLEAWLGEEGPGRLELDQQVVGELAPGYRVYVAAPRARLARKALVESMLSVGLVGEWIDKGELKGSLSLGEYQEPSSAQALLQALIKQGYEAAIYQQQYFKYQYYLILQSDFAAVNETPWVRSLLQKYPKAKSEKKLCQGLATAAGRE